MGACFSITSQITVTNWLKFLSRDECVKDELTASNISGVREDTKVVTILSAIHRMNIAKSEQIVTFFLSP